MICRMAVTRAAHLRWIAKSAFASSSAVLATGLYGSFVVSSQSSDGVRLQAYEDAQPFWPRHPYLSLSQIEFGSPSRENRAILC
jgi:hypothetical protein